MNDVLVCLLGYEELRQLIRNNYAWGFQETEITLIWLGIGRKVGFFLLLYLIFVNGV